MISRMRALGLIDREAAESVVRECVFCLHKNGQGRGGGARRAFHTIELFGEKVPICATCRRGERCREQSHSEGHSERIAAIQAAWQDRGRNNPDPTIPFGYPALQHDQADRDAFEAHDVQRIVPGQNRTWFVVEGGTMPLGCRAKKPAKKWKETRQWQR